MVHRNGILALALLLAAGFAQQAPAQDFTVQGRAFGSSVEILGTSVDPLNTADTGVVSQSTPGSKTETADSSTLDASPLVDIVSSESSVDLLLDNALEGNESEVVSKAGDSVAIVLPGAAPGPAAVLRASISDAKAKLTCFDYTASSRLDILEIGGTPVPVPGEQEENTTIVSPSLPLIILNEQRLDVDPDARSARLTVNALNVQAITDAELFRVILSGTKAAILNVPPNIDCPIVEGHLKNSLKFAEFADGGDVDDDGEFDDGDTVRFIIRVENSGNEVAPAVQVIDRVPAEIDVDESTVMVDGNPVVASVEPCPDGVTFNRCRGEVSQGCLSVNAGDIEPGPQNAVLVTFEATILEEAIENELGGQTCNTARIGNVERNVRIDLGPPGTDEPPVTGDVLRTTGSGGCSVRPGSGSLNLELWPMLLAVGWIVLRGRRRTAR